MVRYCQNARAARSRMHAVFSAAEDTGGLVWNEFGPRWKRLKYLSARHCREKIHPTGLFR
jgi:hypothetical protein